jgi:hypothetical protein
MSQNPWDKLPKEIETSEIDLDRTGWFTHMRFKSSTYPIDYGFFQGITSIELGEVDLWL